MSLGLSMIFEAKEVGLNSIFFFNILSILTDNRLLYLSDTVITTCTENTDNRNRTGNWTF